MPKTGFIAAVLFTIYCQFTLGQQTLGAMNGYVADSSGAVIHGAEVKARAVATNLEVTVNTKTDGSFLCTWTPGIERFRTSSPQVS